MTRKATIAARLRANILRIVLLSLLAVGAMVGMYDFVNSTEQGHQLLIRWGFEYPPDCG
ncbi:MAG TPA: hypothetical protein VN769_00255 [Xanthobacteraceae bacterium]|nr:hypothetical protein [Xanthobacteraceae bacterium]